VQAVAGPPDGCAGLDRNRLLAAAGGASGLIGTSLMPGRSTGSVWGSPQNGQNVVRMWRVPLQRGQSPFPVPMP